MTEPDRDLEGQLEHLTRWNGGKEAPALWRTALEASSAPARARMPSRVVLGLAAMVVLTALGAWIGIGTLGSARSTPVGADASPMARGPAADAFGQASASDTTVRAIQRSATIELRTAEVRSVFEAALALADPSLGEYVQSSSATEVRGEAVLRIASHRLDAVLRMLRGLEGVESVHREEQAATDATDQRIDLDARIANESRIEAELLDLVGSRPDAPLADVLRVREALAEVRLNIELLQAQRASLNERVALATVRVRVERVRVRERAADDAGGFVHDLGVAFARGGRDFARSITAFVEFLVGGLIVWVPLAIAGFFVYRTLRWRATWA